MLCVWLQAQTRCYTYEINTLKRCIYASFQGAFTLRLSGTDPISDSTDKDCTTKKPNPMGDNEG